MNAYLNGLGAAIPDDGFLFHDLVDRPDPAVKVVPFSQITSIAQALNYARRGFHVSVGNGLSTTGTVRTLWNTAAGKYVAAAEAASTSTDGLQCVAPSLQIAKTKIAEADASADHARSKTPAPAKKPLLSLEPGKTPVSKAGGGWLVAGGLLALVIGGGIFSKSKKKAPHRRLAGLLSSG